MTTSNTQPFEVHLSPGKVSLVLAGLCLPALLLVSIAFHASLPGESGAVVVCLVLAALLAALGLPVLMQLLRKTPLAIIDRHGVHHGGGKRSVAWSRHCCVVSAPKGGVVLRSWDPDADWKSRWRARLFPQRGEVINVRTQLCVPSVEEVLNVIRNTTPFPLHDEVPPPEPRTEAERWFNRVVLHPVTRVVFILLLVALAVWLRRL